MGTSLELSWGLAAAAFAGGLVSFFSPCVAPLVPGYIGYLSGATLSASPSGGAAAVTARPARPAAVTSALFVAGFSAAFIAMGTFSASFGWLLAAYRPVMETLAGIVMLVMGAFLLGLLPRVVMVALSREGRWHLRPDALGRWGMAAPVALGVIFAAGWTPCIGPVLASILLVAGTSGSPGSGALLLAVYSLGFALPFIGIGLGWSASLRMVGFVKRYGQAIARVSGVALLVIGVIYLSGNASVFAVWAQRVATP